MYDVQLDRRAGGKYVANKAAAYTVGVEVELVKAATQIGVVAQSILDRHHLRSDRRIPRRHDSPSPEIKVVKGKKLDWYVMLEARGRTKREALSRAVGIEFGHEYESREQNAFGPWGRSSGLHVLGQAARFVEVINGGGY